MYKNIAIKSSDLDTGTIFNSYSICPSFSNSTMRGRLGKASYPKFLTIPGSNATISSLISYENLVKNLFVKAASAAVGTCQFCWPKDK